MANVAFMQGQLDNVSNPLLFLFVFFPFECEDADKFLKAQRAVTTCTLRVARREMSQCKAGICFGTAVP